MAQATNPAGVTLIRLTQMARTGRPCTRMSRHPIYGTAIQNRFCRHSRPRTPPRD